MKTSRKKNLLERLCWFVFVGLISFSTIFINVPNIQAESLLKVNFPKNSIVEHLKLDVPEKFKHAWLKAERASWEPWLLEQDGFLGRQLFWDPEVEEATLLIGWESKAVWKNISQREINDVQQNFEKIAREETGELSGNPFPLIFEGELNPE